MGQLLTIIVVMVQISLERTPWFSPIDLSTYKLLHVLPYDYYYNGFIIQVLFHVSKLRYTLKELNKTFNLDSI